MHRLPLLWPHGCRMWLLVLVDGALTVKFRADGLCGRLLGAALWGRGWVAGGGRRGGPAGSMAGGCGHGRAGAGRPRPGCAWPWACGAVVVAPGAGAGGHGRASSQGSCGRGGSRAAGAPAPDLAVVGACRDPRPRSGDLRGGRSWDGARRLGWRCRQCW